MDNKRTPIIFGILVLQLLGHTQAPKTPEIVKTAPQHLYSDARSKMSLGAFESALTLLNQAYQGGLENPMRLILDQDFQPLLDHPTYRGKVRNLIARYAIHYQATMVLPGEPGERILISGQVLNGGNNLPIPNVSIEFVHTDTKGHYFNEKTSWNPRIFAYVKTDKHGKSRIETIQPGRYQDDSGALSYSHIHFATNCQGYAPFNSEFTFEDDTVLIKNGNPDNVPVAKLKTNNGPKHYHVIIRLQRN